MARTYGLAAAACAVGSVLLIWSTGVHSALFQPSDEEAALGTAQLWLETLRLDLGTIAADQTAQAKFRVANQGTRRLIIRRETGACCGQVVPEEVTLVPPGGSATLTVDVSAGGIRGGLQREIVYATNDPQRPKFRLTVVAQVSNDE